MKRTLVIAIAFTAITAGSSATVATASPQYDQEGQKTGVAIELSPEREQNVFESTKNFTDSLSIELPENAFWMFEQDGTAWFVFSESQPRDGRATVEGTVISPAETPFSAGIIIADSIEWETEGKPIALEQLLANPNMYVFRLIQLNASFRNIAIIDDAGEGSISFQRSQGAVAIQFPEKTTGSPSDPWVVPPGQTARWTALNISSNSLGSGSAISDRIGGAVGGIPVIDWQDSHYWTDTITNVHAIVLPSGGQVTLIHVKQDFHLANDREFTDVAEGGNNVHKGQIVEFEANVIGARISTKKALLEIARCAPDSITNPVTGCAPVTVDTTLHLGIAFDEIPDERSDALFIAGLSNHVQDSTVVRESGRYEITGRVVSTSEIDPRLPDGYGIIIYDKERVGDLDVGTDARSRVRGWSEEYRNHLVDQLNTSQLRWRAAGPVTPTQTSSPIPTRTPTPAAETTDEPTPTTRDNLTAAHEQPGFGFALAILSLLVVLTAIQIRGENDARELEADDGVS